MTVCILPSGSGRRYKILNPERMRDSYGKLMYFLQDGLGEPIVVTTAIAISPCLTISDTLVLAAI